VLEGTHTCPGVDSMIKLSSSTQNVVGVLRSIVDSLAEQCKRSSELRDGAAKGGVQGRANCKY